METKTTPTDRGYLETKIFESPPAEEIEAQQNARSEAARAAEHRVVVLRLGESIVEATVVREPDMWAAGIETSREGAPFAVLLTGGAVPVDSLELRLVDNLLAYLETTAEDRVSRSCRAAVAWTVARTSRTAC
jgi:urease accessory protein UreF